MNDVFSRDRDLGEELRIVVGDALPKSRIRKKEGQNAVGPWFFGSLPLYFARPLALLSRKITIPTVRSVARLTVDTGELEDRN